MPAYRELRQACEERAFDVLWCRARDRLGRTDAIIAQVEALVANAGAEVYSAALPHQLGQSTETSAIYLSAIERAAAQSENVTKTRRHRMGMAARVRNGLHPGVWPYGYKAIRDHTGKVTGAEFTPQIEAVRLATRLYLEGVGYHRIAGALNGSPWRPMYGERWARCTVVKMLHNRAYAGLLHFGDAVSLTDAPSSAYAALWDAETYAAIWREHARRHKGGKPAASIVSGIVICRRCGWTMSGVHKHGKLYYVCNRHQEKRDCHNNSIPAARLFDALAAYLVRLRDPAEQELELIRGLPDLTALAAELERAREALAQIRAKRERLALLVAEGVMTADVYRAADDRLLEDLERAAAAVAAAQTKLAAHPPLDERRALLTNLLAIPSLLDDPANRLQLYHAGIRILVEDHQVRELRLAE